MKRFLFYVSQQPANYSKIVYDASKCLTCASYGETRLPVMPLMNAVVEPGETIDVMLVATRSATDKPREGQEGAFERNLRFTKEEIAEWAQGKGVTVRGLDRSIEQEEPSGMREMLRLFERLIERIEDGYGAQDVFYADITFGTKPMTLILLYVLRYVRAIKGNDIAQIVYGQAYRTPVRDENGAPLKDREGRVVLEMRGELHELATLFYMDSMIAKVGEMRLQNPEQVIAWSLRNAIEPDPDDDEENEDV